MMLNVLQCLWQSSMRNSIHPKMRPRLKLRNSTIILFVHRPSFSRNDGFHLKSFYFFLCALKSCLCFCKLTNRVKQMSLLCKILGTGKKKTQHTTSYSVMIKLFFYKVYYSLLTKSWCVWHLLRYIHLESHVK